MTPILSVYTRQNFSLADTLAAFSKVIGTSGATAILYSPRRCELATLSSGALKGSDGRTVDIAGVFEARVFNEAAELRWLNDPGPEQRHRAVILTEREQPQLGEWHMEQEKRVIETLPQTYLLWGEGTDRPMSNGWSELATARIGGLRVPVGNVEKNQRVLLHSVEYVVEADDHGNAVIFDERLLKLEVPRD